MNQLGHMCHLYSPHVCNSDLFGSSQESEQPEMNSSPEAATHVKSNPSLHNSAHPNYQSLDQNALKNK